MDIYVTNNYAVNYMLCVLAIIHWNSVDYIITNLSYETNIEQIFNDFKNNFGNS